MKVYVDGKFIPEKCNDCKFIGYYEDGIYSRNPHCCCELYWDLQQDEIRVDKNRRDERCPLQSLADYTKQVRKEVCEEIYNKCEPLFRLVNNYDNGDVIERNELVDILDQIQGETK